MRSNRLIAFSLFALSGLSSCLKDEAIEDKKYGMRSVEDINIVEFPRTEATAAFLPGNKDTTVRLLRIRLLAERPATEDITIVLRRNDDLVLNADPNLQLEIPPADLYEIKTLTLVIPKDSTYGDLQIKLNPDDIRGHNYAMGFSMDKTSQVNTNPNQHSRDLLTVLQIRNRYDGRYTVTGTMEDLAVPAITGDFPVDVELHTMGDNTVALYYPAREDYLQPILNAGSHSVYGVFTPEMTFDVNGKITGVINAYGQGANNRSAVLDPTGTNTWDPATMNISIKFTMNQPNINTVRTRFDEIFTYTGPRD